MIRVDADYYNRFGFADDFINSRYLKVYLFCNIIKCY